MEINDINVNLVIITGAVNEHFQRSEQQQYISTAQWHFSESLAFECLGPAAQPLD